jgi:hypothetical protein
VPHYLYRICLLGDVAELCRARGHHRAFYLHGNTFVETRASCPAQARRPFLALAPVLDVLGLEHGA